MITKLTIGRRDSRVVLYTGGLGIDLHWQEALDLAAGLKSMAANAKRYDIQDDFTGAETEKCTVGSLIVHKMGLMFLWELSDKKWFECPYTAALQLGKQLYSVAKLVEHDETILALIGDQATLLQVGCPLVLSQDPKVLAEALKSLPGTGNIKSSELLGLPRVIQGSPNKEMR